VKELIDEIRDEQAQAKHNPRNKQQPEEKEFTRETKKDTGTIVPTETTSNSRQINKQDIARALSKIT
jgi:hypothetical protein